MLCRRSTDCHVASLLAMTMGGRTCTRAHVFPSACHCEPVTGTPQRGTLCGERSPKGALPGSGLWPELGMADFGATRCGNPFSPQKNSASWLLFGQIRSRLRIRPKYCFPSCCTAKSNGLPRRFAPRNDIQKHGRFQRVQAGTTR